MKFRRWLESTHWAVMAEVPQEPGTQPIPADHIRLFHYTKTGAGDDAQHEAAEILRQQGIDIGHAEGSKYGEPNVVWASRQQPGDYKVYAEFSVAQGDPRWGPYWRNQPPGPNGDCYFTDSIRPEEIIAVHEPWHHRYRYMIANNLIEPARQGEFDYILDSPTYAPAVQKAKGG